MFGDYVYTTSSFVYISYGVANIIRFVYENATKALFLLRNIKKYRIVKQTLNLRPGRVFF